LWHRAPAAITLLDIVSPFFEEPADNFLADALALLIRANGPGEDVREVDTITRRPACADQTLCLVDMEQTTPVGWLVGNWQAADVVIGGQAKADGIIRKNYCLRYRMAGQAYSPGRLGQRSNLDLNGA
jgi:hypothetical protein